MTDARPDLLRAAALMLVLLCAGAAWGVAAQLDPRLLTALGAPWLLVAFCGGAVGGRRSWWLGAAAGAAVLVAGVVAYYWAMVVTRGGAFYASLMTIGWSAVALPAGAAFGAAGAAWLRGSARVRALAGALVPAALAAEVIVLATTWQDRPGAGALLAAEAAAAGLTGALVACWPASGSPDAERYRRALALALPVLLAACVVAELAVRGAMRRAGWAGA